jgi:hypothetical protein
MFAGLGVLSWTASPHQAKAVEGRAGWLRVSENGRYFVKDGEPFFWLGDAGWSIANRYTLEEAEYYLERRRSQGFTLVHMMTIFDGGPGLKTAASNQKGQMPFLNMNPATPNDAYFRDIDEIIRLARQKDIFLVIQACGGSSGSFVEAKKIITKENVRAYAKWLGQRYRGTPNIVWGNGFDLKPWQHEDIAREFAVGVQEGDGGAHLIVYHPMGGSSSSYFHHEDWLAANFIQVWAYYLKIYPMVSADYLRLPAKPVVMAEAAYEEGPEYPTKPITPLVVRKEAYWSILAGGFHTYGHNDIWRKNPTWRQALESPGAKQMGILKSLFTSLQWWKLVPDQSVFAAGASGDDTLNAAARSTDGDSIIVYLSSPTTVALRMDKITASQSVKATWVNPETGQSTAIGTFPSAGVREFVTPSLQKDGVLLLRGEDSR